MRYVSDTPGRLPTILPSCAKRYKGFSIFGLEVTVLTGSQPENILLHAPGPYPHVQLADFGLARPRAARSTLNVCGTVSYLPPEGILALDAKDLKYVGMPADCWSVGVVLYIMLS